MNLGEIEHAFDRVAARYPQHDALEREVGERLLERLAFSRLAPTRALDLGSGTGRVSQGLRKQFPRAAVYALDLSRGMLASGVGAQPNRVQADFCRLPFASRSFDLVVSNFALHWALDFGLAMQEIRRVLKPLGMFVFTVPGVGSFKGLEVAVGQSAQMPVYMPDLQELGDFLVSSGYAEPVMDSEVITLSYPDVAAMNAELAVTGGSGFVELSAAPSQNLELCYEVVYGTAFGPPEGQPIRTGEGEVASFSVEALKRSLK